MEFFKIFTLIALLPCIFGSCDLMKPKNGSKKIENQAVTQSDRREVTCVKKDKDGAIIAIGGEWGTVTSDEAIKDIESGTREYYIKTDAQEVRVMVVSKHLRTSTNEDERDNLSKLPECK